MSTVIANPSAVSSVATVIPSPVTDAQVNEFCARVRVGAPASGILPVGYAKLNILTDAQVAAIKQARKDHKALVGTQTSAVKLYRLARARLIVGARFNKEAKLSGLRFGDKKTVRTVAPVSAFPLFAK